MDKITWYGTASVEINIDNKRYLFDPFIRFNNKLEIASLDTFSSVDYIFNTHPHFDHSFLFDQILNASNATAFGSKTLKDRLIDEEASDIEEKLKIINVFDKIIIKNNSYQIIKADEELNIDNAHSNDLQIDVLPASHCNNDLCLVVATALRSLFTFRARRGIKTMQLHHAYHANPEDILAFSLKTKDKKILLFGSMCNEVHDIYPMDVDVLVLPFQGRTRLTKYALPIIKHCKPKTIILTHFDNAFPPITKRVNTKHFEKYIKKHFKDIKVIIPKFNEPILI